ncbi:phosphatidylserine decarboxylase [Candidatus Ichthyocystis hellenicum]|uniref:phosphatidylserine decarboxylase n=1 Tax=Candidatus Ichthyocystis hellenicum TaxID=1561003 RepID=UPI000A69486F|nr:phosphatidylserine decarboxylase [Candidatus Ichthyocystis hellenicum]
MRRFRFIPWIAPEGLLFVLGSIFVAVVVHFVWGICFSWVFIAFAVFITQFFRDPRRSVVCSDPSLVMSAADGRIVCITQTEDPYLKRPSIKVSVFMNIFNVHRNRVPVSGRVCNKWYTPGRFINASLDKSSDSNERCALWLKTEKGLDVVCVQVAGLVARRILCYVRPSQVVQVGQSYGFIRFGSRLDMYLPIESRLLVSLGDRVKASLTALCELPE